MTIDHIVKSQIRNRVWGELHAISIHSVRAHEADVHLEQIWYPVHDHIEAPIHNQIKSQIQEHVGHQFEEQT